MRKQLLNPFAMFIIGLCAGILSRLLDIYTQNLEEIFSQMAVWILWGTLISIYSETPKRAAANTLTFCLGMRPRITPWRHSVMVSTTNLSSLDGRSLPYAHLFWHMLHG